MSETPEAGESQTIVAPWGSSQEVKDLYVTPPAGARTTPTVVPSIPPVAGARTIPAVAPAIRQVEPVDPRTRALRIWAGSILGVAAVAGLAIAVVVGERGPSPGAYTVQLGAAGANPSVSLPQQVGSFRQLMTDPAPVWEENPTLLPSSPTTTYGTVTEMYAETTGASIDIDAVYAIGNATHRGVFSVSPTALESTALKTVYVPDARKYPTGSAGGVLECGTTVLWPTCIWADQSTLIVLYAQYNGATVASFVALTTQALSEIEHG